MQHNGILMLVPQHNTSFSLVECPRDAMQGWPHPIATQQKADYLNALLRVGFHTLDCGSFVSPKAIPQMADTHAVLPQLQLNGSHTQLLTIVANTRGAQEAVVYDEISCIGFPFSISETFQQRNTNASIVASLTRVAEIQELCIKNNKQLVVYMSMGFGNPYGDVYNEEVLLHWIDQITALEVNIISLADTVGLASPEQVRDAVSAVTAAWPGCTIGVHLHSTPEHWQAKAEAAYTAGCRRFDGALKGIGGCPMAGDDLVGNMDTEKMIPWLQQQGLLQELDMAALQECIHIAGRIFV